jgi:hypothetical protein
MDESVETRPLTSSFDKEVNFLELSEIVGVLIWLMSFEYLGEICIPDTYVPMIKVCNKVEGPSKLSMVRVRLSLATMELK